MLFDLVTAFGLAALSASLVRIMVGVGRLDQPGPRSSHSVPTPKGGGVGILAAFVTGLIVFGVSHATHGQALALASLGLAATGLGGVAFLDDLRDWPFLAKLAAQVLAAGLLIAGGYELTVLPLPWLGRVSLGAAALPLALCWIVGVTNAVNFMDGLNGLASGVALIACVILECFTGTMRGADTEIGIIALALAAGIAGFLPYNFPRARIFMGDVGSQPCGVILAALGLLAARPGAASPWLMPMMLFGLLFDVVFTLVRRAHRGERLTQAHRDHLYQRAYRAGVPAPVVAAVHWAMAGWGGSCAVIAALPHPAAPVGGMTLVLLPQVAWLIYVERRGLARA